MFEDELFSDDKGEQVQIECTKSSSVIDKMAPKRKRTTETISAQWSLGNQGALDVTKICLGPRPGMISNEDFMILDARWSNISEEEIMTMQYQEAGRLRKVGEEGRKKLELSPDEKRLAVKQLNEAKRRELIQTKEMNKYFRKKPV